MLTTTEVSKAGGPPPGTLWEWVGKGVVVPADPGGVGRGRGHRFTLTQAVGLGVAAAVHRSERGCVPAFVGAVVAAFGAVTEDWLLERFAEGNTHFVTVHHDKPLLDGGNYDWVDVRAVYERVAGRPVPKTR